MSIEESIEQCGAVLDWHDGEPICCEAKAGTWHWEDHSLKSPTGDYFDYDAPGFKEYVAEHLNIGLDATLTRAQTAEAALKQAAETYIVALDVAEQVWRKELAEVDAALAEAKAALNVADSMVRLASAFLDGSEDYDSWLEEVAAWDKHVSPRTAGTVHPNLAKETT